MVDWPRKGSIPMRLLLVCLVVVVAACSSSSDNGSPADPSLSAATPSARATADPTAPMRGTPSPTARMAATPSPTARITPNPTPVAVMGIGLTTLCQAPSGMPAGAEWVTIGQRHFLELANLTIRLECEGYEEEPEILRETYFGFTPTLDNTDLISEMLRPWMFLSATVAGPGAPLEEWIRSEVAAALNASGTTPVAGKVFPQEGRPNVRANVARISDWVHIYISAEDE